MEEGVVSFDMREWIESHMFDLFNGLNETGDVKGITVLYRDSCYYVEHGPSGQSALIEVRILR